MFVSLDIAKKHLNIDEDFHDDDNYVSALCEVAEQAVERDLDVSLGDLLCDGLLPAPIIQAMLLLVGTLYRDREATTIYAIKETPLAYRYLLDGWRDYTKKVY